MKNNLLVILFLLFVITSSCYAHNSPNIPINSNAVSEEISDEDAEEEASRLIVKGHCNEYFDKFFEDLEKFGNYELFSKDKESLEYTYSSIVGTGTNNCWTKYRSGEDNQLSLGLMLSSKYKIAGITVRGKYEEWKISGGLLDWITIALTTVDNSLSEMDAYQLALHLINRNLKSYENGTIFSFLSVNNKTGVVDFSISDEKNIDW